MSDDGNLVIAEEPDESVDHNKSSSVAENDQISDEKVEKPLATTDISAQKTENSAEIQKAENQNAEKPEEIPENLNGKTDNNDSSDHNDITDQNDHTDGIDEPGPSSLANEKGTGKGKAKAKPTSQPSFDFDYDGPPVNVSNAMALELVNRFGLNNAWGAFLKLRGYRTPYDKSIPQPPEHVQALKRFRRKIRSVREMFNQFRDKNQDTDPFMTKEFVIQLKGAGDDDPASPAAPKKKNGKNAENEEEKPSTSTAINHVAKASPVKSNGETSAGPAGILNQMEPIKKPRKYKKDKKESVPVTVPLQIGISSQNQPLGPSSDGVLNKRIDEIVTNVIDKVLSTSANTSTTPNVSTTSVAKPKKGEPLVANHISTPIQMPQATAIPMNSMNFAQFSSMEQIQEIYRQNSILTATPQAFQMQNIHNLLATTRPTATPTLVSPAASLALNQNAARFFFPQPGPHGFEASAAQILLPPTPQPTPSVNGVGPFFAQPQLGPSLIRALQIQQPQFSQPVSIAASWNQNVVHQPELKPEVMSPKASISTTANVATTSSSNTNINVVNQKEIVVDTPKEEKNPQKLTESQKSEGPSTSESKEEEKEIEDPKPPTKKQKLSITPKVKEEKEKKLSNKKEKEFEEKIKELEDTVKDLESQLNSEKQKNSGQKKRMDTMRDKLKKKDDELQTAKIDYACQRNDNIELKEKILKLTQENERLQKRLSALDEEPSSSGAPESTRDSSSPSPSQPKRRGRQPNKKSEPLPKTETPPAKKGRKRKSEVPVEEDKEDKDDNDGERRQSKRISAARSKLLCSTMT